MTTAEQIWPDLTLLEDLPGWHVRAVASTGSTNSDLVAAASDGVPDRSVLLTAHQTAGRGRLDRRWDAPPGANLLVSILFRDVPAVPVELTHRVALAAADACRHVAGVDAALKWPNDLLVGDRKLAGILAQRAPDGAVVAGLGLNVGWAPEGAARLHDGLDPENAATVTPPSVLRALLEAYDRLPADVTDRYRAELATLGRRVRVDLPDGSSIEGTAIDVDADGRLGVLDTCGMSHRLDVGDVVHARMR